MRGHLTPETVGPLSRPVDVSNLPPHGLAVRVEAAPEERDALARDFNLPAIRTLVGEYRLKAAAMGVHLAGTVTASLTQICVVSLEPFDSDLVEEVEVDFAEPGRGPAAPPSDLGDVDPPDEIVNGQVDLGAITAEFLALGLDPHPRKPGADFAYEGAPGAAQSPFAALRKSEEEG